VHKKKLGMYVTAVLLVTMLLGNVQIAEAAEQVGLAFDGIKVPERSADNITTYYLDSAPEIKNGTTCVPVRLISELLGADVSWQGKNIGIKYGDVNIQLTVGSKTAKKDSQTLTLGAAPYEKNGRTYVPVRFIAEAFDCQVEWANNEVNIHTKPWLLNGNDIVGIASRVTMIVEDFFYEMKSPLFANKIYHALIDNHGSEVQEPTNYGRLDNLDMPNFYWLKYNFSLLANDNTSTVKFEIYECAGNGFGQPLPQGYTKYLMLVNGKWYTISDEAFALFEAWNNLGQWENTDSENLS